MMLKIILKMKFKQKIEKVLLLDFFIRILLPFIKINIY
jgi:hypothetical protein